MTEHGNKLRLALAVYEGREDLWPTLADLMAAGVTVEQVGLVAASDTLPLLGGGLAGPAQTRDAASRLLAGTEALDDARVAGGLRVSAGLLRLRRQGVEVPALWNGAGGRPALNAELIHWVLRGACVLTVKPATPAQLWSATRVLLEYSSCPVQTIETTLAARHCGH